MTRNSAITVRLLRRYGKTNSGSRDTVRWQAWHYVTAHADDAVEGRVDERARIEAMSGEWMFGLALRAVAGARKNPGRIVGRHIAAPSRQTGVGSA